MIFKEFRKRESIPAPWFDVWFLIFCILPSKELKLSAWIHPCLLTYPPNRKEIERKCLSANVHPNRCVCCSTMIHKAQPINPSVTNYVINFVEKLISTAPASRAIEKSRVIFKPCRCSYSDEPTLSSVWRQAQKIASLLLQPRLFNLSWCSLPPYFYRRLLNEILSLLLSCELCIRRCLNKLLEADFRLCSLSTVENRFLPLSIPSCTELSVDLTIPQRWV